MQLTNSRGGVEEGDGWRKTGGSAVDQQHGNARNDHHTHSDNGGGSRSRVQLQRWRDVLLTWLDVAHVELPAGGHVVQQAGLGVDAGYKV